MSTLVASALCGVVLLLTCYSLQQVETRAVKALSIFLGARQFVFEVALDRAFTDLMRLGETCGEAAVCQSRVPSPELQRVKEDDVRSLLGLCTPDTPAPARTIASSLWQDEFLVIGVSNEVTL